MAQYQHIVSDLEDTLSNNNTQVKSPHLLYPTRWTVRTKAISAIINNYEVLYTTILNIAKEATITSTRSTAEGLARKLEKFSPYLGLRFAINIFSVCERASRNNLAKTFSDSANNYHVYQRLKRQLTNQRSSFGQFYKQVTAVKHLASYIILLYRGKHKFHGDCSMEMVSSFAYERQKMYIEFSALKLSMLV